LSVDFQNLKEKIADLLAWERRKRWEGVLASAFCAAVALALVISPLHALLPEGELRWLIPFALLGALAPIFYYQQRWARQDTARAVARLDKRLGLDARAITAWELSGREENGGPAQLVFKQAQEKLRQVDVRQLFPRVWRWPAYLAVPLFILWFILLWLNFDRWTWRSEVLLRRQTLVYQARQYARQLQEKAKNQGLRETLKLGHEVEKAAQKGIANKSPDDAFKKDLAGVTKKFDERAKAGEKN
jgi:hypothetical protein